MNIMTPNLDHPMLQKADAFAAAAHAAVNQKRKYSGLPYIIHPRECVASLQALPASSNITLDQLIAMYCHDTIEDTRKFVDEDGNLVTDTGKFVRSARKLILVEGITEVLIEEMFGAEARRITAGLTDVSMPWDGNREARKAIDLQHTAEQKPDVKTCKLADIESNMGSIVDHDPGFARKWMKEKIDLMEVLSDGDPILFARVSKKIDEYLGRI